jgi:hypothetical protein
MKLSISALRKKFSKKSRKISNSNRRKDMGRDYLKDLPILHYKRAEKKEHTSVKNTYPLPLKDASVKDQPKKKE